MQLPSVSTVADWLWEFKLNEDVQCKLLNIVRAKHSDPAAKEAFISFNEMALKARWVNVPRYLGNLSCSIVNFRCLITVCSLISVNILQVHEGMNQIGIPAVHMLSHISSISY